MKNLLTKILVSFCSGISIAFGVWHFFVPHAWKWYSYMDMNATELVVSIRAINVFFSLSLVMFGLINLLLILGGKSNRYSLLVVLSTTCILWLTRVIFQIVYPQGSLFPLVQYGLLVVFILVAVGYAISWWLVLLKK